MELNEKAKKLYKIALERGFYRNGLDSALMDIIDEISELRAAVVNKNKLPEEKEAKTIDIFNKFLKDDKDIAELIYRTNIKDTVSQEMAGVLCAVLSLSFYLNIDIERCLDAEIKFNELRSKNV